MPSRLLMVVGARELIVGLKELLEQHPARDDTRIITT